MIYLLETNSNSGKVLRISFTSNNDIQKVLNSFKAYNPDVKLLKTREGDKELRDYIKLQFSQYHIKEDWFSWNNLIIDNFEVINIIKPKPSKQIQNEFKKSLNQAGNFQSISKKCYNYFHKYDDTFDIIPDTCIIKKYLSDITLQEIRSLKYNEALVKDKIKINKTFGQIKSYLIQNISSNKTYTSNELKDIISDAYKIYGISKTPKLNDLWKYYNYTVSQPNQMSLNSNTGAITVRKKVYSLTLK